MGNKEHKVVIEVEFSVIAVTIPQAYQKATAWIADKWTKEITAAAKAIPEVIPSNYHGKSVEVLKVLKSK